MGEGSTRRAALVIGCVTLALGAAGHFHGHMAYIGRLNTTSVDAPEPYRPEPLSLTPARHMVVVVIDGLRHDRIPAMPHLGALAFEGVSRPLMADFPSYTYAGITTMVTGTPPVYSGVRLNGAGVHTHLDTLPLAAGRAGIPQQVSPGELEDFEALLRLPAQGVGHAEAPQRLKLGSVGLSWVYFGAVDAAGHRYGAASEAYTEAVGRADALIGDLAGHLDPVRDALVVVSEHGHLDGGGHGGTEPEVLRAVFVARGGPFVRGGAALPPAPMRDLASTLAASLGIAPPDHNTGHPMADALGLAPPGERRVEAPHFDTEGARVRLGVALALCLSLLWFVAIRARRRSWPWIACVTAPALVYGALFGLGYLALGYRWSWSIPRGEPAYSIETGLVGVAAVWVAIWIGRRQKREATWQALAVAILYGVPYVLLSAYLGLGMEGLAPAELSWGLVLWATVIFYGGIAFGLRALWTLRGKRSAQAGVGEGGDASPSSGSLGEGVHEGRSSSLLAADVDDRGVVDGGGVGLDGGPPA